MILNGDCLERIKDLDADSVDALITDPPAGISFMGKDWDKDKGGRHQWVAWMTEVMKECHRVMKPGAHGLVWAIPRTSHWTATALEDAGFEVRDQIFHIFGSGFPKSLNLEKAMDKANYLCKCPSHEKTETTSDMSNLQSGVYSEGQHRPSESEVLQPDLLCGMATHGQNNPCASEGNSTAGSRRLDERKSDFSQHQNDGQEEPSMARREIHRTGQGLCDGSQSATSEGETEWLCPGAHIGDGENSRTIFESGRSCASYQSQHSGQSSRKPEAVCDTPRPLVGASQEGLHCGQCGKRKKETIAGFGTALKPATEVWILVRKPISEKTVAANVLKWGCGGLNIDASRISLPANDPNVSNCAGKVLRAKGKGASIGTTYSEGMGKFEGDYFNKQGRFPANLVLSDDVTEALDEQAGDNVSRFFYVAKASRSERNQGVQDLLTWENADQNLAEKMAELSHHVKDISDDTMQVLSVLEWNTLWSGSSTTDQCPLAFKYTISTILNLITELRTLNVSPLLNTKESILGAIRMIEANGLNLAASVELIKKLRATTTNEKTASVLGASHAVSETLLKIRESGKLGNIHSTVKPQKLMEYLITLITPPKGKVLDPFMGSGSTGVAAKSLGFGFVGIERETAYFEIAKKRIDFAKAT